MKLYLDNTASSHLVELTDVKPEGDSYFFKQKRQLATIFGRSEAVMSFVVYENDYPAHERKPDKNLSAPTTRSSSLNIGDKARCEMCDHEKEKNRERRYTPNNELAAARTRFVGKLWFDPRLHCEIQEQRHPKQVGHRPQPPSVKHGDHR